MPAMFGADKAGRRIIQGWQLCAMLQLCFSKGLRIHFVHAPTPILVLCSFWQNTRLLIMINLTDLKTLGSCLNSPWLYYLWVSFISIHNLSLVNFMGK